jgi:hypothetical protein
MRPGSQNTPNRDYREPYDQARGGGKKPTRFYPQAESQNYGYQGEGYQPYHSDQRNVGEASGYPGRDLGHQQQQEYDNYYYQPSEVQDWGQHEYQPEPAEGYYHGHRQQDPYSKEKPAQGKYYKNPKRPQQPPPFKSQQPDVIGQSQAYGVPSDRTSEDQLFDSKIQGSGKGKYPSRYQKYPLYEEGNKRKTNQPRQAQTGFDDDFTYQEGFPPANPQLRDAGKKKKSQLLPQGQPGPQNTTSLPEVSSSSQTEKESRPKKQPQVATYPHTPDPLNPLKPSKNPAMSGISLQTKQEDPSDDRFSRTMSKLNTLDRGTYFLQEENKKAHFLVAGRQDLLGWYDTYVINGYFLHGVILKLTTLTARIFLFIENVHPIFKNFVVIDDDGQTAKWSDKMPDEEQIVTVSCIEKVEVFDNDEEGFEGFVCYTICEDSAIEFHHQAEDVADFRYVQELILLYEPTSIRKIYLDVVYNSIYKPESKGFGGKRIAAIVNPNVPGETIEFNKKLTKALDKNCIVGSIWIQNGKYTLTAETLEDMERFCQLVDLALDIAEELNAYVMITNLRRTFDFVGKTILYISSDPTVKLIRSNNPIPFASKSKVSENLS